MHRFILTCFFSVLVVVGRTQAQVYIAPNTSLAISSASGIVVEGDLHNNGTIANNGFIAVKGNFKNETTGKSAGKGNYQVAGNFMNSGRICCSRNTVLLMGGNASTISFGTDTIGQLVLDKSLSATLALVGNLKIANSLQFNSDVKIRTNGDTLFLLNDSPAALSTDVPFSNSRFISGNFSRKVTSGATYTFPVGNYNLKRADISNIQNLSGPDMVNVNFKSTVQGVKPLNITNEGPYDSICSPGTWVITAGQSAQTAKMNVRMYTDNMYYSGNMKCAVLKRPIGSTSASDWSTGSGWLRTLAGMLSLNTTTLPNYTERYEVQGLEGEYGLGMEAEFLEVKVKAILSGPWNGTAMNTSLNTPNFPNITFPGGLLQAFALTNPYAKAPWNYTGGDLVPSGFFALPGNANIVDWVLVELRSTATTAAVARKAGFIKKDGSIVDINGTDPIRFEKTAAGNYYIVVKHRNHLPVMSAQPVSLPNADVYDFTAGMDKAYGTSAPMKDLGFGKFGMWAGDANGNHNVRYTGSGNDVGPIQMVTGGITSIPVIGYLKEDLNMNCNVRYTGSANDVAIIQSTVGGINSIPKTCGVPNPNL